jgi:hypothetical protein
MTTPNINPDGFRTVAYLEARARLDARRGKTRGSVRCTPPNTKCGNRCIPPEWDCRLKGEGNDPHLRSVGKGSDPIAGFANIERGIKRLGKGVAKLSFSELEGGRRAIARGAAKVHPGDLKAKEELKNNINRFATYVGAPVAIVMLAALSHRGLSVNAQYRRAIGDKIDDSVKTAIDGLARNTPLVGDRIRAREALGIQGLQHSATAQAQMRQGLASQNLQAIGRRQNPRAGTGRDALRDRMNSVDMSNGVPSKTAFPEWESRSLREFWGTQRPATLNLGQGSLFSVGSTNNLLTRSFGLRRPQGWGTDLNADRIYTQRGLTEVIEAQRSRITTGMQQAGLDPKSQSDLPEYLNKTATSWKSGDADLDAATEAYFIKLMDDKKSPLAQAETLYKDTLGGFDSAFRDIAESGTIAPGIRTGIKASSYIDASLGHAQYLAQRLSWQRPIPGSGTALLLRKAYHSKVVMGQTKPSFSMTDTELVTAASELRGTTVGDPSEALRVVNEAGAASGWRSITRVRRAVPTSSTAPRAATGVERPARRRSRGQAVAALLRQKNPDGTPRYATRAAAENAYEAMRRRDSVDARLDKRCGKSGIPDNRKCSKQTAAVSATSSTAERPTTSGTAGSTLSRVGKAAAIAGTVAGLTLGGRYAYKNRQSMGLYKNSARYIEQGIKGLSDTQVRRNIAKLPKQWQQPASKLLGKAKLGLAYVAADAQGLRLKHVDTENNFSTWHNPTTGHVLSMGSVDDTLVTFVAERKGKAGAFDKYGVAFQTDLSFSQKEGVTKAQSLAVSKQVKSMFNRQLDELPENAVLFNKPFKDDGLGAKRASIYKRFKFRELNGLRGNEMYALKNQGKLTRIPEEQEGYIVELIRGGDTQAAAARYQARPRRDHGLLPNKAAPV